MGSYIPTTKKQQEEMLESIGYDSFDSLFAHIPREVMDKGELEMDEGCSELEVKRRLEEIAGKNKVFRHIFRGGGAYSHYIPSIVKSVTSKETFLTAYTPYQAEISQGNLQAIYEFQTMICELTGMDAANASVYDGAVAAAEAVFMCRDKKRTKVLVSQAVNPQVLETVLTYCYGRDARVELVPLKDGETDPEALSRLVDEETACFYMEQPNYYGILEDGGRLGEIIHKAGGRFIMGCSPIALGIIKTPGEWGADIAVGEGQPLGLPLSFGGPYLGFMAVGKDMMRKLPGRIVGKTKDSEGKRGFVLTLQAREQHIRREKAGSNICSNQALCALTASVYLSAMGPSGLKEVAVQCTSKAHYLQKQLEDIGFPLAYDKPFFHEFVTKGKGDTDVILKHLEDNGYLGGLPLEDGSILWCATEVNTRKEMDTLVSLVKEELK